MIPKPRYLVVIGPTASGKSATALELAKRYGGELVNCDSVQVYRGFDIGSAKPSAAEQAEVPHHLIDCVDWNEPYDARVFADQAERAIQDIEGRGRLPILVGGTGLYLRALWQEAWHDLPKDEALRQELASYSLEELRAELLLRDPRRAAELHPNDRFRLTRALEVARLLGGSIKDLEASPSRRDEAFVLSMTCPRDLLHQRIAIRSAQMLNEGLVDEVRKLLASGVDPACKPMQSIGYSEVVRFLNGALNDAELLEAITIATRQYAKRQETLFRKTRKDWEQNPTQPLPDLSSYLSSAPLR